MTFGVEDIPREIRTFDNKNIITNIFRIQAYNSILCEYFCIPFINFMFKDKTLKDFTNAFLPHSFEKNDNSELFFEIKYKHTIGDREKMSEADNEYIISRLS